MTGARRERINSSFMIEFQKQSHVSDNITIYEGDFLGDTFYSAYFYDDGSNTAIYIATPSEVETLEMIKTLQFR